MGDKELFGGEIKDYFDKYLHNYNYSITIAISN